MEKSKNAAKNLIIILIGSYVIDFLEELDNISNGAEAYTRDEIALALRKTKQKYLGE